MKKYLFILILLIGCTSHTAKVTWEYPDQAEYDFYLIEMDKIIIVDTLGILKPYYKGRLNEKEYLFEIDDDKNMVLVGIRVVGKEEFKFAEWNK
jgi:hypothetical protein